MIIKRIKRAISKRAQKIEKKYSYKGLTKILIQYCLKIRPGYKIYKKNAPNSLIVFCPYRGTGDVYLSLSFFRTYLRDYMKNTKISLYVIGKSNQRIAQLFEFDAISLSDEEMDSLLRFGVLFGFKKCNMFMLHHCPPIYIDSLGVMDVFRNYNGLTFEKMFSYGIFELDKKDLPLSEPIFDTNEEWIEDYFKINHLQKGKTVLISYTSYSMEGFPGWGWIEIARRLVNKGYSVCSNIGYAGEWVINGTTPVNLPYSKLKTFLETANYFLAQRNGLCDVVSSIKCQKIIIYPPIPLWYCGTVYDYFSLREMELDVNTIELEYEDNSEVYDIIRRVVDAFP